MGALAELLKLGMKTAVKQADEVVPKTLSRMRSDYTPSPIVDETTDVLTALGRSEDDIVKFKKENLLEGSEKEVYRNSKLEEQARALDEGLITLDEFKEARDIFKPRRTYGTVPKLYELFDILGSMGKSVKNKGIVGVNKNIKSGELVNTRFDVKAYENYGRYVVTVGKGNKVTGYAPTAILKNVKFAGNPSIEEASKRVPDIGEKSFNLAKGKRIEGGKKLGIKSPFATMEGKWQNMSPESTHKYAEDLMDAGKVNKYGETDKEWTEIGFDPASKSSFYNRSTGKPIFAADKVVQVGSMLLARGIKKPTKQQLKSLQFITKAGKEIEGYKEGGSLLPVIKREAGGGGSQNEAEAAAAYDDYTSAYESPSGFMDDTDAGLYADKYGQPGKHQSPEDRMNNLTGTDTRYNPLQSPEMKVLTGNPFYFNPEAPKNEEEQRQQDEQTQLFENYKSLKEADPLGHLTSFERKNEAILEMIERRNRLEEEYGITINSKGQLVRMDSDEVAPMAKGGQVLEGLDREYMRQRNSKEKVEGMMGILPIQPRQYGGGLDDAYMNRRSAFAAPDANSAFASPMGRGDLPTMYRQEGGDIPITSVNGQGIRRVIYRESGGGLPTIYRQDGGGSFGDYPSDADFDDAMADSPTDDGLGGDYGGDGGLSGGSPAPAAPTSTPSDDGEIDMRGVPTYGYIDPENPYDTSLDRGPAEGSPGFNQLGDGARQGRGNLDLLSQGAYNKLVGIPWVTDSIIANMTAQQLSNFQAAFDGKSFGGDMRANDFSKGYRFGGAEGTLQDILETSLQNEVDISDLTEQAKYRKEYEKEFEKDQLSETELDVAGLKGFASDIADKFSIQSNLKDDPYIMDEIAERANAEGLNFQPVSPFMAGLMDYGISAIGGLVFPGAGSLAKGLSNMTGAGRTIGTVTKDGLQYNLSDTGKFSLNTEPTAPDYGNDEEPKKRSKPIEEKITETVTEDKPLTGMAGLLAKRDEPVSREASNKYSRNLLDSLGYGNINLG